MFETHDYNETGSSDAATQFTFPGASNTNYSVLEELVRRVAALNDAVADHTDKRIRFSVRDLAVLDHLSEAVILPRSVVSGLLLKFSDSGADTLTDTRVTTLLGRYEDAGLVRLVPGRVENGRWEGTWVTLTSFGFRALGLEPSEGWREFTRVADKYLGKLNDKAAELGG